MAAFCCQVVTTLPEVDGVRIRQEGCFHSTSLRTKTQSKRETERYPGGLHKNTGHAYSQDVLSFMLGRDGGRGVGGRGYTQGRIIITIKKRE